MWKSVYPKFGGGMTHEKGIQFLTKDQSSAYIQISKFLIKAKFAKNVSQTILIRKIRKIHFKDHTPTLNDASKISKN